MPSTINIVAWSLEVEVQFYLLMPLLAWIFYRGSLFVRRASLVGLMVVGGILSTLIHQSPLDLTLLVYLQYFAAGLLLADIHVSHWKQGVPRAWLYDLAGVVIALLFSPLFCSELVSARLWLAPWCLAFYFCVFKGPSLSRLFSNALLTAIGGMCYTIYLFHGSIVALASKKLHGLGWTAQIALQGAITLSICSVFFLLIEKPCMSPGWPKRLAERMRLFFS
jgi:peptidoglycan/LPS O-acetylase OafA/YrhL